jgi:CRISPR/Cas system-associated protein endoribonuclease Cas2
MLRYLLYAFLIYLAYRLIFHFIIPVYKTTKQVKKQFREMHSRMEDQMNQQSSYARASENNQPINTNASTNKEQAGDYIDFEELK